MVYYQYYGLIVPVTEALYYYYYASNNSNEYAHRSACDDGKASTMTYLFPTTASSKASPPVRFLLGK